MSDEQRVLGLIAQSLREGKPVEIDGFGSFKLSGDEIVFDPDERTRIFLSYAEEDRAEVKCLSQALQAAGFDPWMDQEKLLPGQNWSRAIQRAIEVSDFCLLCFSDHSVDKRGYFQSEIRHALSVAKYMPLDEEIFLVPVRLSECDVPAQIAKKIQYLDLFPDWDTGVKALTGMLKNQSALKKKNRQKQRRKKRLL